MTKRGDQEPADPAASAGAADGGKGPAFPVHEHIGRQLRGMFEDVVAQPVPERLRRLLDELERKQPKD